jgi:hypothetical protein
MGTGFAIRIRANYYLTHFLRLTGFRLAGKCYGAVKLRLTLFLQPNHGFGESFRGSGGRRPHDYSSHAALEPA